MSDNVQRTEGEPHDRLTRIAKRVIERLEADPEYEDGMTAIVMLDHDDRGGIGLHGYDDDREALANMVVHLEAIFRGIGLRLDVVTLDDDGVGKWPR